MTTEENELLPLKEHIIKRSRENQIKKEQEILKKLQENSSKNEKNK